MTFLDADAKALEHALRRDGFDQDDARAAAAVALKKAGWRPGATGTGSGRLVMTGLSSQRTVTIEGLSEDGALRLAEVFIPLLRSTGGHITITWTVEQGAS